MKLKKSKVNPVTNRATRIAIAGTTTKRINFRDRGFFIRDYWTCQTRPRPAMVWTEASLIRPPLSVAPHRNRMTSPFRITPAVRRLRFPRVIIREIDSQPILFFAHVISACNRQDNWASYLHTQNVSEESICLDERNRNEHD